MIGRPRWHRVGPARTAEVIERLAEWPCPPGGAVRHMFPLATLETHGPDVLRVAERGRRLAACVVLPGQLLVPCGDAELIAAAGTPTNRWRLVVGDAAAADAVLAPVRYDPGLRVHIQRFQTVDPDRVPDEREVPDPGLRLALPEDVPALTELAVQLHVDDGYGPHPGRSGYRGYRARMVGSVASGRVLCVGARGEPVMKIERAVTSDRFGVQLSGVCVTPSARAKGLGKGAMAAAVRATLAERPGRAISLHVRADNRVALRAYEVAGFVDREEWRLAVRP